MSPATGSEGDADQLWVRVGGGLEELPSGRRHGPADPGFPPPDGPWEELKINGRLVGWIHPEKHGRAAARRAEEEGQRVERTNMRSLEAREEVSGKFVVPSRLHRWQPPS